MNDVEAMRQEVEQLLADRRQQGQQALIDAHGGLAGWFRACRARRSADLDHKLAQVILRQMRRDGDRGGGLRLMPQERDCLAADPAVEAYFYSVAHAGTDGWREERRRVIEVERGAARSATTSTRPLIIDVYAVRSLMPVYRAWGQVLLDLDQHGLRI